MKGADGRMRGCVKGLFLLLLLALLPCVCLARDESLFAHAAREYEFDSWRGQTKAAYARRLTSYDLPLLPLMTNSPTVRVDRQGKNSLKRLYVRHDGDLPSSLRIVTGVATSEVSAQEFMIRHLGTCLMGCHDYTLYEIGDRGYSVITNQWSTLVFTRNNIYVEIQSTTNLYSAESLGRQIDADILRKSTEVLWGRWAVAGVVLLGLSLFIVRRRRTKPRRTGASPGKSDDTKKEKRRKPGIARVMLGVVVLLVFGAIVYSPWGRQAVERLVLDVFRRMAERSR